MRLRPPLLVVAAYGAGLVTGLLLFGDPAGVVIVVGGWCWRRFPLALLLAAAALLGRVSGEVARWEDTARCSARLPARRFRLRIRPLEPVDRDGGLALVQPLAAGCIGPVVARWPVGQEVLAGTHRVVVARWVPRSGRLGRPAGTLVIATVGVSQGHPTGSAWVRNAMSRAARTLYGRRAPLVDALVLGQRGGLDRDLQDQFVQSGLVHLLAISGFHVGLVAGWIFLLGRWLRLSRAHALALAALAAVGYAAFLGWPAPATRAAALIAVLARCHRLQRRVQGGPLLAATALGVLLVDPWAVMAPGAWLSFGSIWGAATLTGWTDRVLGQGVLARGLGSSLGATLATAPITAAGFGSVAVIGVFLNFVAIPLAAVAVPGVFASLLVFPFWSSLAESLAAGSGLALHLLELVAGFGASLPGGHIVQAAEPRSAVPWLLILAVMLAGLAGRSTLAEALRRWSWLGVVGLWGWLVVSSMPAMAHASSGLTLHFLDVGQGDAALLRTPAGRWILIDAGPADERRDAGRSVVVPFLRRVGAKRLAAVVVSHAHADHLGGVASVLARYPADIILEPAALVPDPGYGRFLSLLEAEAIPWRAARAGDRFELDGVRFTVWHPIPSWSGWGEDVNEDSVVLLIEYGEFQAVFSGDAGLRAEAALRSRTRPVDLLKVGHHGSRWSTGDEWLDSLRPRAAIVSVGRRNRYGHPAPEALARLAAHGVRVWRTDREGTVTVTTDGRAMQIHGRSGTISADVH